MQTSFLSPSSNVANNFYSTNISKNHNNHALSDKNVIPSPSAVRTDGIIRLLPGERFTPFGLALQLDARILFESSSFRRGRSRYSLLVLDEAFRLIQRGNQVLIRSDREEKRFDLIPVNDILDAAVYFANQHPALHQNFPYPCGGFGYLGYEFAAFCDNIQLNANKQDDIAIDDGIFLFGHIYLVFDHHADVIYLHGVNYDQHQIDLVAALDAVEAKLATVDFRTLTTSSTIQQAQVADNQQIQQSEADFLAGVHYLKQAIYAGEILQAVLSRRITVQTEQLSIEHYRRLRSINPSPYMFHINFGDFQLFGTSPEMLIQRREDLLVTRPLAGTRKRCNQPEIDAAAALDLRSDVKELAEHRMLVDLARNDLGRIAEPGTVRVTKLETVEEYSHLMHLASQVEATVSPGVDAATAIRACFPAGTVSGAPKIRAMELVDQLETSKRSFYAGLVGYLEPGGNFDTCIAIRCGLQRGNQLYLQAGAGIVHDSDPVKELQETNHKLQALLTALTGDSYQEQLSKTLISSQEQMKGAISC